MSPPLSRSQLVRSLQVVQPALAINQLIPLLTHYWFTGRTVMGYNDQIALAVPLQTEFRGAVPGKFLELLQVESNNQALALTHNGQELVVKQGKRTNFRLAMLEPNFIYDMPAFSREPPKPIDLPKFLDAIKHCLISVGRDTSTIEQLGITLEPDHNSAIMYATDGGTISRAILKNFPLASRVILPTMFCEQMLLLYSNSKVPDQTRFELGETETNGVVQKYALFGRDRKTRLYGRLLESRSPLNLKGTVEYHLPNGDYTKQLVKVPELLQAAVERACIVCDAQRRLTRVTVDQGKMVLRSKSDTEQVTDEFAYPHKGSERVEIQFEPKLLKKANDYDKMLIHGPCVVMAKDPSIYLISCSTA